MGGFRRKPRGKRRASTGPPENHLRGFGPKGQRWTGLGPHQPGGVGVTLSMPRGLNKHGARRPFFVEGQRIKPFFRVFPFETKPFEFGIPPSTLACLLGSALRVFTCAAHVDRSLETLRHLGGFTLGLFEVSHRINVHRFFWLPFKNQQQISLLCRLVAWGFDSWLLRKGNGKLSH